MARKRGGRRRQAGASGVPPAKGSRELVSLRSVEDIQRLLERAVADTLGQRNGIPRARTIGYLVNTAIRALELGEMEQRVAALEAQLAHFFESKAG